MTYQMMRWANARYLLKGSEWQSQFPMLSVRREVKPSAQKLSGYCGQVMVLHPNRKPRKPRAGRNQPCPAANPSPAGVNNIIGSCCLSNFVEQFRNPERLRSGMGSIIYIDTNYSIMGGGG